MQNMALEGWAGYWKGFPPFFYGTHALSPILSLTGTRAQSVICHGSGALSPAKAQQYGSPYAVETATFKLANSNVIAEATRCLFETVRQVVESFDIYGDRMSFEWEQVLDDGCVLFEGIDDAKKFHAPDTSHLLPPEIAQYTKRSLITDPTQPSFIQGAGHGGSHPHLVHEFLSAIVEGRNSHVDAVASANYTCAGICAHQSAMKNGETVRVPDFGSS
jgi:predicted dehydrogenase